MQEKMNELILSFHILLPHLVVPVLYHISGPNSVGQVVRKFVKEYEIQSDSLHLLIFPHILLQPLLIHFCHEDITTLFLMERKKERNTTLSYFYFYMMY